MGNYNWEPLGRGIQQAGQAIGVAIQQNAADEDARLKEDTNAAMTMYGNAETEEDLMVAADLMAQVTNRIARRNGKQINVTPEYYFKNGLKVLMDKQWQQPNQGPQQGGGQLPPPTGLQQPLMQGLTNQIGGIGESRVRSPMLSGAMNSQPMQQVQARQQEMQGLFPVAQIPNYEGATPGMTMQDVQQGMQQGSINAVDPTQRSIATKQAEIDAGVRNPPSSPGSVSEQYNIDEIVQGILDPNVNMTIRDVKTEARPAVAKALQIAKENLRSSGNMVDKMKATAGGRLPSDTFIQSFEKTGNVLYQLSDLQQMVTGEETGPILGILRSANPYDVKAQQIKAQLASIVPNLARGVYGEVGVLTDNDIKNYTKTIANLQNPEDVRNAIMGATLRTVQRSLDNKIAAQMAFGRDVSNAVEIYQKLQQTADYLSGNKAEKTSQNAAAPQTEAPTPQKQYQMTATNPNTGQKIGSNDGGQTWKVIQ